MKCDICGTESDFDAGFIKERRSFRSSQRTLCLACWSQRRHAFEGWYQIAVIIGGIIGYILLWSNPWSVAGRFLTVFFLVDLFLVLSIVPHELGHAIAGRLLGWRVFAIVIGVGKQVFKFRLFGIIFSFRWLPICGITQLAPMDTRWFRLKRFFVYLAGPAINASIAAAILLIWWDSWRDSGFWGLPRPARICIWANLWIMAANLWPFQSKILNRPSDGKQLLKTFSKGQKDAEELQAARFAIEAMLRRDEYMDNEGAREWCNKGLALFPQNLLLLNVSGVLCLDQHDFSRAREIFLQLLPRETKPNGTRYIILNNIAYADALIGDSGLLPEADTYSKEAYAAVPWIPSITGTRGTVLVAMGQIEAGIKLLKESFERAWSPRSKAENACHLAMAYARLGNRNQADNYLKLAGQLDSQCRLIERARKEFQNVK